MEAAGTHLSRHFLTCQPQKARNLPFAPAGAADADGTQLAHKLLAIGNWNEDNEVRPAFIPAIKCTPMPLRRVVHCLQGVTVRTCMGRRAGMADATMPRRSKTSCRLRTCKCGRPLRVPWSWPASRHWPPGSRRAPAQALRCVLCFDSVRSPATSCS